VDPAVEQAFVADVTANVFKENQKTLSSELIKSNSLVEAQEELTFDRTSRTLRVGVASVFRSDSRDNRDMLAYNLATAFAPVFWGPEVARSVRPESTVLLSVAVDNLRYLCSGETMVALADREVSQQRFLEQCSP
jgi:hypothetical protein